MNFQYDFTLGDRVVLENVDNQCLLKKGHEGIVVKLIYSPIHPIPSHLVVEFDNDKKRRIAAWRFKVIEFGRRIKKINRRMGN